MFSSKTNNGNKIIDITIYNCIHIIYDKGLTKNSKKGKQNSSQDSRLNKNNIILLSF